MSPYSVNDTAPRATRSSNGHAALTEANLGVALERMPTPSRLDRWGFRIALGGALIGLVVGSFFLITTWPPPAPTFGFTGFQAPVGLAFVGMGALILRRRPGNAIGWLLLLGGMFSSVQFAADLAPAAATRLAWGSSALVWTSWISNLIWVASISVFGPILLLFPDGQPPTRRWGWLLPLTVVGASLVAIGLATSPGPLANYPSIENPVPIGGDLAGALTIVGAVLLIGGSILSAVTLVFRWRKSSGDSREQLKWLAAVGLPLVVSGAFSFAPLAQYLMIGFVFAMPIAVAVAVLRHRLYDIDEIISRTVAYGVLTAILAGVFAATLKLSQDVFTQVTGAQSDGAIVVSTLVIAAAFTPIRKALDQRVDRRFKPMPAPGDLALVGVAGLTPAVLGEFEEAVRRVIRAELGRDGLPGADAARWPDERPSGVVQGIPQVADEVGAGFDPD